MSKDELIHELRMLAYMLDQDYNARADDLHDLAARVEKEGVK